jgi:hypothetical protein
MKFRLKFLWFEIEIETPEPVQVSSADIVSALWTAIAENPPEPIILMREEIEDEGE